jgi:hypothetical protein
VQAIGTAVLQQNARHFSVGIFIKELVCANGLTSRSVEISCLGPIGIRTMSGIPRGPCLLLLLCTQRVLIYFGVRRSRATLSGFLGSVFRRTSTAIAAA